MCKDVHRSIVDNSTNAPAANREIVKSRRKHYRENYVSMKENEIRLLRCWPHSCAPSASETFPRVKVSSAPPGRPGRRASRAPRTPPPDGLPWLLPFCSVPGFTSGGRRACAASACTALGHRVKVCPPLQPCRVEVRVTSHFSKACIGSRDSWIRGARASPLRDHVTGVGGCVPRGSENGEKTDLCLTERTAAAGVSAWLGRASLCPGPFCFRAVLWPGFPAAPQ